MALGTLSVSHQLDYQPFHPRASQTGTKALSLEITAFSKKFLLLQSELDASFYNRRRDRNLSPSTSFAERSRISIDNEPTRSSALSPSSTFLRFIQGNKPWPRVRPAVASNRPTAVPLRVIRLRYAIGLVRRKPERSRCPVVSGMIHGKPRLPEPGVGSQATAKPYAFRFFIAQSRHEPRHDVLTPIRPVKPLLAVRSRSTTRMAWCENSYSAILRPPQPQ